MRLVKKKCIAEEEFKQKQLLKIPRFLVVFAE